MDNDYLPDELLAERVGPHRTHVRAVAEAAGLAAGEEGWVDSEAAGPLVESGALVLLDG